MESIPEEKKQKGPLKRFLVRPKFNSSQFDTSNKDQSSFYRKKLGIFSGSRCNESFNFRTENNHNLLKRNVLDVHSDPQVLPNPSKSFQPCREGRIASFNPKFKVLLNNLSIQGSLDRKKPSPRDDFIHLLQNQDLGLESRSVSLCSSGISEKSGSKAQRFNQAYKSMENDSTRLKKFRLPEKTIDVDIMKKKRSERRKRSQSKELSYQEENSLEKVLDKTFSKSKSPKQLSRVLDYPSKRTQESTSRPISSKPTTRRTNKTSKTVNTTSNTPQPGLLPSQIAKRLPGRLDPYIHSSSRPLSPKLAGLIALFSSSLFNIFSDIEQRMGIADLRCIKLFDGFSFITQGKLRKTKYLQTFQESFEEMITHFRGRAQSPTRSLSKQYNQGLETGLSPSVLKEDPLFRLMAQLANPSSILLLLSLYFRVLLFADQRDKAQAIGLIFLCGSLVLKDTLLSIEAYYSLGLLFEKQKLNEKALLCFTRALQHSWLIDDKVWSFKMYDKIGLQLYILNEIDLAGLFHDRMIEGFEEPLTSNAMIRSREIIKFEEKLIDNHFTIRDNSLMDKYRALIMLMRLEISPIDSIMNVQKDADGSPLILVFLNLVLNVQKLKIEEAPPQKKKFPHNPYFIKKKWHMQNSGRSKSQNQDNLTEEGQKELMNNCEFIPKVSKSLKPRTLFEGTLKTHYKDSNIVMHYLTFLENPEGKGARLDFEHNKTRAKELARKNSLEDMLLFLSSARLHILKELLRLPQEQGLEKEASSGGVAGQPPLGRSPLLRLRALPPN